MATNDSSQNLPVSHVNDKRVDERDRVEAAMRNASSLARISAKTARVLALVVGFYAIVRFLEFVESIRTGSSTAAWIHACSAFIGCIALVLLSRHIMSRSLSRHLIEPTRQILLSQAWSYKTPWQKRAIHYAGVFLMGLGAALFLDSSVALNEGSASLLLPVHGWWLVLVLIPALALEVIGFQAVRRTRPFMIRGNREALFDVRPIVLLLGAFNLGPIQEEVISAEPISAEPVIAQSKLSQLIQLLWLIGPVVAPDDSGVRRDGQGAAVVTTSEYTNDNIVRTLAAAARLIVVILADSSRLRRDLYVAANADRGSKPLVILVPIDCDWYERTRQYLHEMKLPPINTRYSPKRDYGMIFGWSISRSKDGWITRKLIAKSDVTHLGIWLNRQLKNFKGTLVIRPYCVSLRLGLYAARHVPLSLLILLLLAAAWRALHG